MRTQKRAASAPKTDAGKPETPQPSVEINELENKERTNRVSFNVSADGIPDFARMQSKTREQLANMLRDKSVQRALGISPEEAAKVETLPEFDETEVNALLDVVGKIDAFAASKVYSISMEVTAQAFEFSPEHRRKLNPGMVRLLNKWGPMFIKTWKDEIGVALVFFSVLTSQVRAMHFLEEKRKRGETSRPSVAPRPVSPISEPVAEKEIPKAAAPENIPVVQSTDVLDNVGVQAGD